MKHIEKPDSLEQKMCNDVQMKSLQQKHSENMSEIERIELKNANTKITMGCVALKENALNTGEELEKLFARLFKNEKAGILLLGTEEKFLHAFCLWKRGQLMDCLTEIIVTCELEELENIEYLLEKLQEYEVM